MFRAALFSSLFLASFVLAAPVPKALKAKSVSIGGSWLQVEQYLYGRNDDLKKECIWNIDAETLIVSEPNEAYVPNSRWIRFSKMPDVDERAYSYRICSADGTEDVYPARIEIENGNLRIAFSVTIAEYPIDTQPSKSVVLLVFKRSEK